MTDRLLSHKGETWNWSQFHKWSERVESGYRFKHDELGLVTPDSRFFCMGSCFADNVAAYLREIGIDAWSFGHSRLYDTASVLMTVKHLLVEPQYDDADMFATEDGRVAHPFRNWRIRTDTLDEMRAWSAMVEGEARAHANYAEFVVITLGGTEMWRDPTTRRPYLAIPMPDVFNTSRERIELHEIDYAENVANIEAIYDTLREAIPGVRVIFTVSPIRMTFTVSERDVAIATAHGKSVLRAAVGDVVERPGGDGDLFYFHSYEVVQFAPPGLRAFDRDDVHVTDECVRVVMHEFARCFLTPEARGATYELEEVALASTGSVQLAAELAPLLQMSDARRVAIRALRTLRLERPARSLFARFAGASSVG